MRTSAIWRLRLAYLLDQKLRLPQRYASAPQLDYVPGLRVGFSCFAFALRSVDAWQAAVGGLD